MQPRHPDLQRRWFPESSARRLMLLYLTVGLAWITVSDWLFDLVARDAQWSFVGSLGKAWLFVGVTSVLLYVALARLQARNRQAARLLVESEYAYRAMFANNPSPMWVYDITTRRFLAVNEAALVRYGYSRGQFLRMTLYDLYPLDFRAELDRILAASRVQAMHGTQTRHRTFFGEELEVELTSHTILFGGVEARLVLAQDITHRLRAERALQHSQSQLREAQRIAGLGAWSRDIDTGAVEWGEQTRAILGLDETVPPSHETFIGLVHADDVERVLAAQGRASSGLRLEVEHRICRPDGEIRHVTQHAELVVDHGSRRLVGTLVDVTERTRAERALAESERRYRQLVEGMPDGLLVHDADTVRFANLAMARLAGFQRPEQLEGERVENLVGDRQTGQLQQRLRNMLAPAAAGDDGRALQPRLLRRADGSVIEVEVASQPVTLDGVRCAQVVVRDVRVQNRMQRQLAQANERLSRLSSQVLETAEQERRLIARELHDDVGQLLTFAKMTSSWLLRRELNESSRPRADALPVVIGEALDKVRNLALMLRPAQLDQQGLCAAIRAHLERYLAGMEISWELHCADLDPRPDGTVEIALLRIFQEALTNAIKHSGATQVEVRLGEAAGWLVLTVRDDGCGFDQGDVLRQGGSLGLLTMRERVHLVDGTLTLISQPGAGTTVRAEVPYASTALALVGGEQPHG